MADRISFHYLRGALYGIACVCIWAGYIVVARLGIRTSLTPWDIAAVRFAVAGAILMPVVLRHGVALDRLGWSGLLAIALGGGAPMVLCANVGLAFAPAAQAGALFPGVAPLMVAILAAIVLKEEFSATRRLGLGLILAGVLAMLAFAGATIGGLETIGQALFVAAAMLWAGYTIAMRRARLRAVHAAAIAAVISLLVYLPIYVAFLPGKMVEAPLRDIALQAFVQGVLTGIVALIFYGRAINLLGASSGAAFGALCPVATALFAVPILGELPAAGDWIGIVLISAGVYVVSGGPLGGNATRRAADRFDRPRVACYRGRDGASSEAGEPDARQDG